MAATKPRISPSAAVREIDGEAVVFNAATGQLEYLNHSAAVVFDLCDGTLTAREMAKAIADVYEMDLEEVETLVRGAIRGLRERKLLEPARPGDAQPAAAHDHVDERELVRTVVPRSP